MMLILNEQLCSRICHFWRYFTNFLCKPFNLRRSSLRVTDGVKRYNCMVFYLRWQEVQSARVGSSGDHRAEDSGLRPPTGRFDSCYEKCQGVRRQGQPDGEDRVSEHTAADAVDWSKQLRPWQFGRGRGHCSWGAVVCCAWAFVIFCCGLCR